MPLSSKNIPRRAFLTATSRATAGLFAASALPFSVKMAVAASSGRRLKVAAVITEFSYRSHGHIILENFVAPYLFNGKWISPDMDVVSMYVDQFPAGEIGRAFAEKYHIPIYK